MRHRVRVILPNYSGANDHADHLRRAPAAAHQARRRTAEVTPVQIQGIRPAMEADLLTGTHAKSRTGREKDPRFPKDGHARLRQLVVSPAGSQLQPMPTRSGHIGQISSSFAFKA